jgi:pre-rRNA-processing protein TSR3
MVRVFVISYGQDDPKKCSAIKMVRLGYAIRVSSFHELPRKCLVLNPLSNKVLTPSDRDYIINHGLAVIDVSWNEGVEVLKRLLRDKRPQRVLPILFAGNPINYAVATKLSSLEAVAAALFITGFKDEALKILSIVKWGDTFYKLNKELLELYSKCTTVDEVNNIQKEVMKKILTNG